jgi:hypothetical protein
VAPKARYELANGRKELELGFLEDQNQLKNYSISGHLMRRPIVFSYS